MAAHGNSLNLLLVDDDDVDRKAVRRALDKLEVPVNVVEASDGAEALSILAGECDKAPPPPPFLILLDINMPRMDGIEFLKQLRSEKTDPKLRDSIVFVLSTSEADKDLERAYAQSIAGYLVKSDAKGGLNGIAELLDSYRQVVVLP